jgi:membrane-bound ClpP family serine protease
MSLTLILLLILLGLILLLLEIFVVPGTSFFGVVGGILIVVSVWQSYAILGTATGNIVIIATAVLMAVVVGIALKSNTWNRMMLKTSIDGRVNEIEKQELQIGDLGKSVSRISPAGTAIFNDNLYEVHTNGDFIDPEIELVISKIEDNKIFVKRK